MKYFSYILSIGMTILSSCSVLAEGEFPRIHKSNISLQDKEGTLGRYKYTCSVKGPTRRYMYVYLPPSYYTTDKTYPTVYLLHGANGNETSWIIKGDIIECIDSLTSADIISECIYVFPNMNNYVNDYDYGDSREKKSFDAYLGLNGSVEYAFMNDVVEFVDRHFRTVANKKDRAIAGLSLGGLQSIYISCNNPDAFGYIGLFSPLIYPPQKLGRYMHFYEDLEHKLRKQFIYSPEIYWIMIGEDDFCFNSSCFYNRLLTQNNLPHRFNITDGGHTWDNWKSYAIRFLKELWKDTDLP